MPAEIEGGVRRERGDQNGQRDEIRIVCSGNDHRDRLNFGDASADSNAAGNVTGAPLKADVGRHSPDDLVSQAFRMLLWHFAGKIAGKIDGE